MTVLTGEDVIIFANQYMPGLYYLAKPENGFKPWSDMTFNDFVEDVSKEPNSSARVELSDTWKIEYAQKGGVFKTIYQDPRVNPDAPDFSKFKGKGRVILNIEEKLASQLLTMNIGLESC